MAETIANRIRAANHQVWLDQWRIRVGHDITAEIDRGVGDATFVIVLLTKSAVESTWVEREWRAAHAREVASGSVMLLPAVLQPCAIPPLLSDKKYASLAPDLERGIADILDAIRQHECDRATLDFYAPAASLLQSERSLAESSQRERNDYWDEYQATVDSLSWTERRDLRRLDAIHYLDAYGLTVRQLKVALAELGFEAGEPDDYYDDAIAKAVERFQRKYNLRHVDGIFGPVTYLAMAQVAGRG